LRDNVSFMHFIILCYYIALCSVKGKTVYGHSSFCNTGYKTEHQSIKQNEIEVIVDTVEISTRSYRMAADWTG
jgi:hypothetical protein